MVAPVAMQNLVEEWARGCLGILIHEMEVETAWDICDVLPRGSRQKSWPSFIFHARRGISISAYSRTQSL